jgi:hypothetical protein
VNSQVHTTVNFSGGSVMHTLQQALQVKLLAVFPL